MSHVYLSNEQEQALVKELMAKFPAEFGLRSFPGDRFRISARDSYWSCEEGAVLLYTEIYIPATQKWLSFAKGTVSELTANIVRKYA